MTMTTDLLQLGTSRAEPAPRHDSTTTINATISTTQTGATTARSTPDAVQASTNLPAGVQDTT
jgi:hypothetical protein